MYLFLIGMPGSGKSYWLSRFAEALQLPPIDLDTFIESTYGTTISEMIEMGISYFRTIESHTLQEILKKHSSGVLATGGGTPCYRENLALIQQYGVVVYISCPLETLKERLLQSEIKRPLLNSASSEALYHSLIETFHNRKAFYEQADITFEPQQGQFGLIIQQIQTIQQKNAKRYV